MTEKKVCITLNAQGYAVRLGYEVGLGYDGVRVGVTRSVGNGDGVRKSSKSGVGDSETSEVTVASSAGFGSCKNGFIVE